MEKRFDFAPAEQIEYKEKSKVVLSAYILFSPNLSKEELVDKLLFWGS